MAILFILSPLSIILPTGAVNDRHSSGTKFRRLRDQPTVIHFTASPPQTHVQRVYVHDLVPRLFAHSTPFAALLQWQSSAVHPLWSLEVKDATTVTVASRGECANAAAPQIGREDQSGAGETLQEHATKWTVESGEWKDVGYVWPIVN